jgi:hypothetical protein
MKIISPQLTVRVASLIFLIIFFQGMFSELFIRSAIIVPGDAATTVKNMIASEFLFRLSIASDLIRQFFLILLPLVLYTVFKVVNQKISSLMVIFALVCIPISMLNELNHLAALYLSSQAQYLTSFKADQLQNLVMFFLEFRKIGTFIPQLIPVWLLLLGYLVFRSGFLPRFLGVFLIIGSLCYALQALLFFLFPNFDAMGLGLFAFIGEMLFYIWLLIRGINVQAWEKLTHKPDSIPI